VEFKNASDVERLLADEKKVISMFTAETKIM
jgi:hypothetical protein